MSQTQSRTNVPLPAEIVSGVVPVTTSRGLLLWLMPLLLLPPVRIFDAWRESSGGPAWAPWLPLRSFEWMLFGLIGAGIIAGTLLRGRLHTLILAQVGWWAWWCLPLVAKPLAMSLGFYDAARVVVPGLSSGVVMALIAAAGGGWLLTRTLVPSAPTAPEAPISWWSRLRRLHPVWWSGAALVWLGLSLLWSPAPDVAWDRYAAYVGAYGTALAIWAWTSGRVSPWTVLALAGAGAGILAWNVIGYVEAPIDPIQWVRRMFGAADGSGWPVSTWLHSGRAGPFGLDNFNVGGAIPLVAAAVVLTFARGMAPGVRIAAGVVLTVAVAAAVELGRGGLSGDPCYGAYAGLLLIAVAGACAAMPGRLDSVQRPVVTRVVLLAGAVLILGVVGYALMRFRASGLEGAVAGILPESPAGQTAMALTGIIGGALAVVAAIFALFATIPARWGLRSGLGLGILAVVCLVIGCLVIDTTRLPPSFAQRVGFYRGATEAAASSPGLLLVGSGPGGSIVAMQESPEAGTAWLSVPSYAEHAHNEPLEVLLNGGLVLVTLLAAACAAVVARLWARRDRPEALALLAVWAAIGGQALVESHLSQPGPLLLLGLLAGLSFAIGDEDVSPLRLPPPPVTAPVGIIAIVCALAIAVNMAGLLMPAFGKGSANARWWAAQDVIAAARQRGDWQVALNAMDSLRSSMGHLDDLDRDRSEMLLRLGRHGEAETTIAAYVRRNPGDGFGLRIARTLHDRLLRRREAPERSAAIEAAVAEALPRAAAALARAPATEHNRPYREVLTEELARWRQMLDRQP